ncbi:hypothetical protein [Nocardioides sp. LML1-1-1.1]|uniref:hypothetical protein n=1 Tax=Nocardioides sp. LML1-1-1.1 TaxID=3135248 RepID=UPI003448CED7
MAGEIEELRRELDAWLTGGPLETRWLDLASALLRFCHVHRPAPAAWSLVGGEPWVTMSDLQTVVVGRLRRADGLADDEAAVSSFATIAARAALADLLPAELDRAPAWFGGDAAMGAAVVARAVAGAVDEVYGSTFVEHFHARGEHRLRVGEAYPVLPRSPAAFLGEHRPNSRPSNLPTRELTALPHLRLALRDTSVDYVLDFDSWNRLGPLGSDQSLRIAIGQPNLALDELDIHRAEEPRRYTNRGPRAPERQARRVARLAAAAGEAGADVLLLPEYTLNDDTVDHLRPLLRDLRRAPRLVVGGSCGITESGALLNEAWLCLSGTWPSVLHEVVTPPKLSPAPVDGYEENIEAGSEVRVHVGQRWTIAVLICRDAMNTDVLHQLAEIGVNLVLVPAMTSKSRSMTELVTPLLASSQAFVALVAGPAHWVRRLPEPAPARGSRVEAVFGAPYDEGPPLVELPRADDPATCPAPTARGVWIHDSAERTVRWIETELEPTEGHTD